MSKFQVALLLLFCPLLPRRCVALRHEGLASTVRDGYDDRMGDRYLPPPGTSVSEEDWPRPRIIYGIHTSNDEKRYGVKLRAQFDTWARDIPQERMLVVGPSCTGTKEAKGGCLKTQEKRIWDTSDCNDGTKVCKVMTYMQRAYARIATLDFDWLFGMNEDQYIVEHLMAKALRKYNSSEPVVLTGYGCGRKWKYDPRSQNGTVPKPPTYTEHGGDGTCPFIDHHGAICGGTGIAYSRAAVAKLVERNGWGVFANTTTNVDPAMTCLLADAGVEIRTLPWHVGMRCPPFGPHPNAAAYHLALPTLLGDPVADYMRQLHHNMQAVPRNQSFPPTPKDSQRWPSC